VLQGSIHRRFLELFEYSATQQYTPLLLQPGVEFTWNLQVMAEDIDGGVGTPTQAVICWGGDSDTSCDLLGWGLPTQAVIYHVISRLLLMAGLLAGGSRKR
jgi:hypothetical protein